MRTQDQLGWEGSSLEEFKVISNKGKQVPIIDGYVIKARKSMQGSVLLAHKKIGEIPGSNVNGTIIDVVAEKWP